MVAYKTVFQFKRILPDTMHVHKTDYGQSNKYQGSLIHLISQGKPMFVFHKWQLIVLVHNGF